MTRRALFVLILIAIVIAIAAVAIRWARRSRDARARAEGLAAVAAVIDTTRAGAWIEPFTTSEPKPLRDFDARWQRLFGNMLVDPRLGVVGDPDGGWVLDGGDDYAFRLEDVPTAGVEVAAHAWWNGDGAIGIQAAVQPDPPHRLYEATLWRRRLEILYFHGPEPDRFEVLAASDELDVGAGHYLIILHADFDTSGVTLSAALARLERPDEFIARLRIRDARLPPGGIGIGLLGGGYDSWVGSLGVQPTQHHAITPSEPVASTP